MVRTIRIKTEKFYKDLLKLQGELQAMKGETKTMDDVIFYLLKKAGRKV